jgi:hypothetical protein
MISIPWCLIITHQILHSVHLSVHGGDGLGVQICRFWDVQGGHFLGCAEKEGLEETGVPTHAHSNQRGRCLLGRI